MAFGTIPRAPSDDTRWRWYNTVGGRQTHLRPDNHGTTRAILSYARSEDLTRLDQADALRQLRNTFAGAGWEALRVLEGFDTSDDVYIDYLTQIRMPSWHRGRVVLAGDAGWCVTPIGGGGASLALTSGYVLAANLAQGPDQLAVSRSGDSFATLYRNRSALRGAGTANATDVRPPARHRASGIGSPAPGRT